MAYSPKREEVQAALALLGKARNYVVFADVVVSDIAEKVLEVIAVAERKVAELPTEESGGSPEDTEEESLRVYMVSKIRNVLNDMLGEQGEWSSDEFVARLSDEEVAKNYRLLMDLQKKYAAKNGQE